jgi:SAM-dependent methyltransferase
MELKDSAVNGRTHYDTEQPLSPNPGLPREFLSGTVVLPEYRALLADPAIVSLISSDDMPIPATADRERYYDDRHMEYWLSGYGDYAKIRPFLAAANGRSRYLDFGGATGRVARHVARDELVEVWLCDINANYIVWLDRFFNRPIRAFQNRISPALPFEDRYFDFVSAFSVFTHLNNDEIPWLLELRRIVRPGGHLYLSVLDENVWDRLKDPAWGWLLKSLAAGKNDAALAKLALAPLDGRVVLEYSDVEAYNANTFLPRSYIRKKWGPLFGSVNFIDDHHNFQTVVVLARN